MLCYLDTSSGIAGDMMLAALVDAGADRDYLTGQLRSLGLPEVQLDFSETQRHCFRGLRLDVRHPPEHAHRHLADIEAMLQDSRLVPREKEMALRLFRKLAAAEARVHGTSLEEVHFHEVGAIDSIVDIVGIAIALCQLNVSRLVASPTPTGCGTIRIAHGTVSVPAPATAELLRGVPIRSSTIPAELTTPTGAAILSVLVDSFGPLPDIQISRIGYGAGHRDLQQQANLLRILIGIPLAQSGDEVCLLETNVDDATGEQLGFAIEQLWQAGALDVFTTAIGMKKNRPATLVSVVCHPAQREALEDTLFQHTGSLGIRRARMSRRKLHREITQVTTPVGEIRIKVAWSQDAGGWSPRFSPEYEDCRRCALDTGHSLDTVFRMALTAADKKAETLAPPHAGSDPSSDSDPFAAAPMPGPPDTPQSDHDHHGHDHHGGHHHH